MSGIERIVNERNRQLKEWTIEHDDDHGDGELAAAASCYAMPDHLRPLAKEREYVEDGILKSAIFNGDPPEPWPWEHSNWKPSPENRIKELVKAGALIVAEIDRLERIK